MKMIIVLLIFAAAIFLVAPRAFASNLPSVSPNPITVGGEASATVSFSSASTYAIFYLFNNLGISLNTSTAFTNASSPLNWLTAGLPTGLSAGSYELAEIDFANPADVPTYNANCGTGNPSSSCSYGAAFYGVTISSPAGTSSASLLLDDPPTIFSWLLWDIVYALISVVIIGIFVAIFR